MESQPQRTGREIRIGPRWENRGTFEYTHGEEKLASFIYGPRPRFTVHVENGDINYEFNSAGFVRYRGYGQFSLARSQPMTHGERRNFCKTFLEYLQNYSEDAGPKNPSYDKVKKAFEEAVTQQLDIVEYPENERKELLALFSED